MLYDHEREARQLFELGKPSLKALSYALRHPEDWPKGFQWDFGRCITCAMGLAVKLWNLDTGDSILTFNKYTKTVSTAFDMDLTVARNIFGSLDHNGKFVPNYLCKSYGSITPEMVADEIDRYLAEKG